MAMAQLMTIDMWPRVLVALSFLGKNATIDIDITNAKEGPASPLQILSNIWGR
jgi:hypothetical protein